MPGGVWVAAVFLVPATAAAGYYFLLVLIGRRAPDVPPAPAVWPRLAVLVPAHDEELTLAATLDSVRACHYRADRLRVLVVADNCSDDTAEVARRAGAEALVRTDPDRRGKGYALELGLAELLAGGADGVIVLDADCDLPAGALHQFAAELTAGTEVVQAARVPRSSTGAAAAAAAAGSWIENAVSAGRCRARLPVALRGSGMLLSRAVLERVPWRAYGLVEDAEYGRLLVRAGVRVKFRADIAVRGEVPADTATLAKQRARWRAALFSGGARALPGRWLASKPLVLAHLTLTAVVTAACAVIVPGNVTAGLLGWLALVVAMTAGVYAPAARAAGGWRVVAPAAAVAARLAGVTLAGAVRRPKTWERTRRAAEAA